MEHEENPPQNLGHAVDLENVYEGQGSPTSTRKLVQTTQSQEVEYSQVRKLERAQILNPWKKGHSEVSSHSASTRKLAQTATPRTEFQNTINT